MDNIERIRADIQAHLETMMSKFLGKQNDGAQTRRDVVEQMSSFQEHNLEFEVDSDIAFMNVIQYIRDRGIDMDAIRKIEVSGPYDIVTH